MTIRTFKDRLAAVHIKGSLLLLNAVAGILLLVLAAKARPMTRRVNTTARWRRYSAVACRSSSGSTWPPTRSSIRSQSGVP